MRLTSAGVERTLNQIEAQVIPDDHPLAPQLKGLFGDHTFFLATNGLNIVEPAGPANSGAQVGKLINLANWSDENAAKLEPHEPELTDVVVELGTDGSDAIH